MEPTSNRLLQGAGIYQKRYQSKWRADAKRYPDIVYPMKVERDYFSSLRNEGKGSYVAIFEHITYYKKIDHYRQVNY